MAKTEVTTSQIKDGTVNRDDLNTTTTTKAVVAKIIAGTGVTLSSTGVDAGTGDVTVNASGAVRTTVQTANATITTIATLSPAASAVMRFSISIIGRLNNVATNKSYWADIEGAVRRNNAGSAVLVGDAVISEDSEGTTAYLVSLTLSGNNLLIQVTGAASETVNWVCNAITDSVT